jgi:glutamine cyclotransferase
VQVLATYPHDRRAFTQGLLLHDGALYESTGLYGRSSLRKVEIETGKVLQRVDLPPKLFGEGLALVGDRLIQLTWQEHAAPIYALQTFEKVGQQSYPTDGWGLCFDGESLVMTDGSHRLYFRDPRTFALRRQIAVMLQGRPLPHVNELECVGDVIYANVWPTDRIVEIAERNGTVLATIDGSSLLGPEERKSLGPDAVLNGIAYDPRSQTFLITGKLWPKLLRVRFVPQ